MPPPNTLHMPSRERNEDPFVQSYKEMLAVIVRMYEATGQLDLKEMIDRAHAQLGRVPHR